MKYLTMTGFTVRTGSDRWSLGYEGENNSRTLQIKTTDDLTGFATVNLLIDTLDCGAMTVTTISNYKVLSMVLTAGMLGEAGKKTCQLLMMDSEGTVVKKTNQFQMMVGMSNDIEGTVPESERIVIITDYIEEKVDELLDSISGTVSQHTEEIEALQEDVSYLKDGEVTMNGTVIVRLYPKATEFGTTSSDNTKTLVFPVESNKAYYITWGERCTKWRIAFGDTPADEIANATPVYNYTNLEGTSLSTNHFKVVNTSYQYMYVYIGNVPTFEKEDLVVTRNVNIIQECLSRIAQLEQSLASS